MMRGYFDQLADAVCTPLAGLDRVMLYYAGESSDFIRFNHARVRQATHVTQHYGTVSVVAGLRQSSSTLALTGRADIDIVALLAERAALAEQLPLVPEDAHLLLPDTIASTEHDAPGSLPSPDQVISAVARYAEGADLVGIYGGGPVMRAFADSRGQRNWHRVDSFLFEWCLYREGDQAVKTSYAGSVWDEAEFARRVASAREQAALLALPRRTLPPGDYRAYFSPVAMADILGTLCWGGFGLKDFRTGVSTLTQLHRGDAALDPMVSLAEATESSTSPRFQPDGFVKPASVPLIQSGRSAGHLVCARTAREYGVTPNGAQAGESPESLSMAPGTLPPADALRALGTGVYLSDLHYLNYSDRLACRITGMTRFACFWVEDGRLAAPIAVMRFDDSVLRMFGSGLVDLTTQAERIPDNMTYISRRLGSVTAPGAIVEGFRFVL
jgi:predicted Zn-dependent protease